MSQDILMLQLKLQKNECDIFSRRMTELYCEILTSLRIFAILKL
jgi:hypothetical protein